MTDRLLDRHFCTVDTTSGKIRGLISGGIRQFKGVPYAAPATGSDRFRRPQPPLPWVGVRDCFGDGQVSPQLPSDVSLDYGRLVCFDLNVALGGMGEDCLHLNIWTPGTGSGERRAVLFSIHGGGFAIGSGNAPMYDGARLAGFGDVVVVTVTHRLASFGFLALAEIAGARADWPDAGAAGMLDLVAALEWVRDNIAGFGGDPDRVMIYGQSGGGWKVSTLLAMPAARGLFHRAAVQSGSWLRHLPRAAGAHLAEAFIKALGLSKTTLHELETLPWTRLLAAQTEVGTPLFAPVLDDVHLTRDPWHPAAPPESHAVPLIVSTTLDDAGLFFTHFGLTEAELVPLLTPAYGAETPGLLALYRDHFPDQSPYLLHARIISDAGFRRLAHLQAERKAAQGGAPVYTYLWEWPSPAYDGKFGAVHAMDVSASFHNDRDAILGSGSRDARLMCETLARAWVEFAKTGDPNHAGIPTWRPFDPERRSTMIWSPDLRLLDDPYPAIRAFWAGRPEPVSVFG
jgi:para-nitrobenzyl esterase